MENGSYGNANRDYAKLALEKAQLSLFDPNFYGRAGCGANALALLTGKNPYFFTRANKLKNDYNSQFMRRQLRKYGFGCFKITKCSLSSRAKNDHEIVNSVINPHHLLLVSQLLKRNEASWFVYWNGISYHNFEIAAASFGSVLNFPIMEAYVLHKPSWKKNKPTCVMNEKEFKVERCKLDLRESASRMKEAKSNLDYSYKKSQADVEKAKFEMEREYARLKEELERATIKNELEKLYLKLAESELEKGYSE